MNTNLTEDTKFWQCLDHWHRVIQHMLRRGRAPRGITDEAYIRLHRDLLAYVQVPTLDDSKPVNQLLQSLHHSVRPWVTLESLSRCDKRILRMLEQEITEARSKLVPRHHWQKKFIQRSVAAIIVLGVVAMLLGIFITGDERARLIAGGGETVWQYADGARAQLWLGAMQSSTNQRLVALAGAIVVVGMFFLRDPKRS